MSLPSTSPFHHFQDVPHDVLAKDLMRHADDVEYCRAVLEKMKNGDIDLNAEPDEITFLHASAASVYDVGMVKFLLEKGMDVHARYYDATPLAFAAGDGHLESVKALIEAGAECDDEILYTCLRYQKASLETLAEYWHALLPTESSLTERFEGLLKHKTLPLKFDSNGFLNALQEKDIVRTQNALHQTLPTSSHLPHKLHL